MCDLRTTEASFRHALTFSRQLFVKCMDNGLAIMPAPIFLVTDDPKVTTGRAGDDHLLDVCHLWPIFNSPSADIYSEGQLPPSHVRRHGTDDDQRIGDPKRNSRSVLQRVNYLQSFRRQCRPIRESPTLGFDDFRNRVCCFHNSDSLRATHAVFLFSSVLYCIPFAASV